MRTLICSLGLSLLLTGCGLVGLGSEGDVIEGTGTVAFIELEGGFYGIIADDGTGYDPVDLPAAHQVDGQRVRYRLREADTRYSYHMWGLLVNVIEVEALGG